jgi:hypothetical protein
VTASTVSMTMHASSQKSQKRQYETPLLTQLLRLCEPAIPEAQPVWPWLLQIFSFETPR